MKVISLLICLCPAMVLAQGHRQRMEVQQPVIDFFEGLSGNDLDKMRENVATDFTLLEHGVVWTMDTIAALTKRPRPEGFKRLNEFDFFETVISKDMAFVSYYNTAFISTTHQQRTVRWLESAVLVNDGTRWKIRMMHSTRLPKPTP